jgi:hypothetical protein
MELTRCSVVNRYQLYTRTPCLHPVSWLWMPQINLKRAGYKLAFYYFLSEKNIIRKWRLKSSRILCHVDWQIVSDFSIGPVASASRGQKFQVYLTPWQISEVHHCYKNPKSRMMRRNIHRCIKAGLFILFKFQCFWDMLKITTDFTIEALKISGT